MGDGDGFFSRMCQNDGFTLMTLRDKRCQLWQGTARLLANIKIGNDFFFFNPEEPQCNASDSVTQAREQLEQLTYF